MQQNKLRLHIVIILTALTLVFVPSCGQAQAQVWPQRPVKIIVPLGPGAGVDITTRLLSDGLATRWGQSVVVDNRPGGDGVIAITAFTGAQDDHTFLMTPTSSFTHHPWLYDKLPYDPSELVPIARVSNTIVSIVVPASAPIHSLSELVAMARAQPGKLNWASITGFFDFVFEAYLKKADLDMTRVPYRNTVQAANDLAEGRIHVMLAAYAIVRPLVDAGKLRILAFTAHERAAAVPDVPTAKEAGVPDLTIEGLVGLFGPRNLSGTASGRIMNDVRDLLTEPTIVSRLTASGQVVNFGTATEFSAAISLQHTQAAEAGKVLGKIQAR